MIGRLEFDIRAEALKLRTLSHPGILLDSKPLGHKQLIQLRLKHREIM